MLKILKKMKFIEWIMVFFAVGFITTQVWLDLEIPNYMKEITKLLNTDGAMSDIWLDGLWMLLCALGSLAAAFATGFFAALLSARVSRSLRSQVNEKVMTFSMEEINHFSTGSLITRSTNDVRQLQTFIAIGLQVLIKAPIMGIWAITKIAGSQWEWTALTGVAIGIMAVLFTFILSFTLPKFKKIQKYTDSMNLLARENLTGVRVVRAYNAQNYQETKFNEVNNSYSRLELLANRAMSLLQPFMMFIMSSLSLLIYWLGAYIIDNTSGPMDRINIFSDMMVFTSYAVQIIFAFIMTVMVFVQWPRAQVSAKRINEVLEKETKIIDGSLVLKDKVEKLSFNHVSFKYPNASDYSLEDITFEAKKGEKVAIIGATGSGKSTLINLLLRFYDTTSGSVDINSDNIKSFTQESLRDKIGYASQKAVLFKGSIKENINIKDENIFDEGEITRSIKIAQAEDFIENKDGKEDFILTQGGTNLSGGQKQRVSIARTIFGNSDIYIFDDTFSALDYKTDRNVREALKEKTKDVITFIVAQRIGTIMDANKIIVLDEGKMVGMGTHKELLKNCKIYQEIAYSQLSKEELNARI